jgi:HAE1 family hydrophobic/amphiphilic exporter-1
MARFFVNRPIVAMVLSIIFVLLGLVAMRGLPIAQYPEIVPPMIQVTTTFIGASSTDVEASVATPLEQQINGVENMIYMKSTNANDGTLTLKVSFEVGSDLDMNNVLTQNRVSQGMPQMPQSVKQYGVTVKKSLAFPLMVISVKSPKGTYDNNFLGNYATININDAIARIPGVGQVTLFGGSDYAMRVWLRPDRIGRLGITVPDIANAISQQNQLSPAGQIGGPPASSGTEYTYTVRTQAACLTKTNSATSSCARRQMVRRSASRTSRDSSSAPCFTTRWAGTTASRRRCWPSTRFRAAMRFRWRRRSGTRSTSSLGASPATWNTWCRSTPRCR